MDVEYIVDCAAELGQLTPVEHASIYLLDKAYAAVDRMIAWDREMPDHFLPNVARHAFRTSEPDKQHWVALNSLRSLPDLARLVQERASHLIQTKVQGDLGKTDPGNILEGLSEEPESFWHQKAIGSEEDVTETNIRAILNQRMGGFLARLFDDNLRLERALEWYRADDGAAFRALQATHANTVNSRVSLSSDAYARSVKAQKEKFRQDNKRPVRGAIKKVCKLFAQFRQEDNLRLFVSGQEVELSHPDSKFKFILRPLGEPGWLEERSANGRAHTPYDLSLLTKDDVFIAKLCVYFKDTPVLDQLLALSLFVQSGEELKVLEKANFFSVPDTSGAAQMALAEAYPSLAQKLPQVRQPVERLAPAAPQGQIKRMLENSEFGRREAHWEPFKGRVDAWIQTWFEPALSQLLPKADLLRLT
jgi:hypothetical protein